MTAPITGPPIERVAAPPRAPAPDRKAIRERLENIKRNLLVGIALAFLAVWGLVANHSAAVATPGQTGSTSVQGSGSSGGFFGNNGGGGAVAPSSGNPPALGSGGS